MSTSAQMADWVKKETEFLLQLPYDDRMAALPLLFAEVMVQGFAKGTPMTPATKVGAVRDLAKHLIRHAAAFVAENRTIWLRNGKP